MKRTRLAAAALLFLSTDALAFTHIVRENETLAQIATRVYGSARFEAVLVGANALDSRGGSPIVSGMPIEIPAPGHTRVSEGETWGDLALNWLGDAKRSGVLAKANGGEAWIPPQNGQEIEIPAVIAHIAAENESIIDLSLKYFGNTTRGWEIDIFNGRTGYKLKHGEVVLVPIVDLELTEAGKAEARRALGAACGETRGGAKEAQKIAEAEIPQVLADVRNGRYVDAVGKANRLLGSGELTKPELARLHRALLEAYVALDAVGLASGACSAWRANVGKNEASLDPRLVSPKIRAACGTR